MLLRKELPDCPVATIFILLGNKWKVYILEKLQERPHRFNELRNTIPGISNRVLTDNIRAMEEDGLVIRTVYPEVPVRVEYSLSELGQLMEPMTTAMKECGIKYQEMFRTISQE